MADNNDIKTVTRKDATATDQTWTGVTGTDVDAGTKRALDVFLKGGSVTVTSDVSTTQTVHNKTTGAADVEVSQALGATTKQLLIRCRTRATLKYTFTATESGSKFITISPGAVRSITDLGLTSGTIYFQADKASVVVEIEEWT